MYELVLRMIIYSLQDKNKYQLPGQLDMEYTLQIDLKNNEVRLLEMKPFNFFPTPAPMPVPEKGIFREKGKH